MSKVSELADRMEKMSPQAAGMLGEALMRALGIRIVYVAAPAPPAPPKVEEQTEFDVVLTGFEAEKKVAVIREVRALTGLGLVESKAFVESAPKTVKSGVFRDEAERIRSVLTAAGGQVTVA